VITAELFLHHSSNTAVVSMLFDVSEATVRRIVGTTIPLLYNVLREAKLIEYPDWSTIVPGFAGSLFNIDCTSHFRRRVHPGQHLYYRGDKHAHFLTAQVMVSLTGVLYDVQIALGHNNDKGVFNLTVRDYLEQENLTGLADRGYSHPLLVRPDNTDIAECLGFPTVEAYGSSHAAARSPAEIINSSTKSWAFASQVCGTSPEFQAFGLMTVYYLVAMKMRLSPLWLLPKLI
jgi:hypothetical protein